MEVSKAQKRMLWKVLLNYGPNLELTSILQIKSNPLFRRRRYSKIRMRVSLFLRISFRKKRLQKWKRIGISRTDMRQDKNSFSAMKKISNWNKKLELRRIMLRLNQSNQT